MSTSATRFSAFCLIGVALLACAGEKPAVSKGAYLSTIVLAFKSGPTSLVVGTPASGRLEASDPMLPDSSRYDQWTYDGRAGEKIRITMESSDFDAFLLLGREAGGRVEMLEQDDDGAGGTNARISVELP